jgi:hypothetical protein
MGGHAPEPWGGVVLSRRDRSVETISAAEWERTDDGLTSRGTTPAATSRWQRVLQVPGHHDPRRRRAVRHQDMGDRGQAHIGRDARRDVVDGRGCSRAPSVHIGRRGPCLRGRRSGVPRPAASAMARHPRPRVRAGGDHLRRGARAAARPRTEPTGRRSARAVRPDRPRSANRSVAELVRRGDRLADRVRSWCDDRRRERVARAGPA